MNRMLRFTLWGLAGLAVLLLTGFLWLRTTPYWAGMTLFSEGRRVENFRNMDAVFPHLPVARAGAVWRFSRDRRPLPETYAHEGERRDLGAFLDRTQTTGLLVVHDGAITYEDYRLGADERAQFTSWSVAKSILSALIGIAVDEGHIADLRDPIGRYVPGLDGTAYGAVPIEDALTMSSGIDFDENYDDAFSDVNMLFIQFAAGASLAGTLAELQAIREPGIYNDYISSDTIALGLVLEGATGMPVNAYAASRLWGPLGAEADAYWNTGRAGSALTMCCFNATLRDYARFGRLYLEGGAREGRQIVPAGWVEASVHPTAPHLQPGDNPASFWTFGYGYKWWIPEDSDGDFTAMGIWGQYVYVDPARKVVIVKTSADPLFDDRDHETIAAFRAIARAVAGGEGGTVGPAS